MIAPHTTRDEHASQDASRSIRLYYVEFNSGYCIPHNKLIDRHRKGTICVPAWVRMHILCAEPTSETHASAACDARLLLRKPCDFAQFTSKTAFKIIITRTCFRPKMRPKRGVQMGRSWEAEIVARHKD